MQFLTQEISVLRKRDNTQKLLNISRPKMGYWGNTPMGIWVLESRGIEELDHWGIRPIKHWCIGALNIWNTEIFANQKVIRLSYYEQINIRKFSTRERIAQLPRVGNLKNAMLKAIHNQKWNKEAVPLPTNCPEFERRWRRKSAVIQLPKQKREHISVRKLHPPMCNFIFALKFQIMKHESQDSTTSFKLFIGFSEKGE